MTDQVLPPHPTAGQRWNAWLRGCPNWFQRLAHSVLIAQLGWLLGHVLLFAIGRETFDEASAVFAGLAAITVLVYGAGLLAYEISRFRQRRVRRHSENAA